jgi:hypothetical protein
VITLEAAQTLSAGASVASMLTCTVYGLELSAGVEVYKVLDQRQLASSPATIYTVPGSTSTSIYSISVVNNDTVARTFQFFVGGVAAGNAITTTLSLGPNYLALYEDAKGWRVYDDRGQLATVFDQSFADPYYGIANTLAESMPRNTCIENFLAIPTASGTLFLQSIYLRAGMLISNVLWCSATQAASVPTHYAWGLYDQTRSLLARTDDQLTAAWAANTLKTVAFTVPYLVPVDGFYYIGFYMVASTIITSKGGVTASGNALRAILTSMAGSSTTGLTTVLPTLATAPNNSTISAWCSVS